MVSHTTSWPMEQMAVPRLGKDIFAAAEFDTNVSLWSLPERKCVARLETILDFGGERLAIALATDPIVATGSWTRGIRAYGSCGGGVRWSRRDISNIQQVCDLSKPNEPTFGVSTERGLFFILDGLTGTTKLELSHVERVFPSCFDEWYLCVSRGHVQLSRLDNSGPVWKKKLVSFAVLHAAFSTNQVVYAEAAGAVHCCDFIGREAWKLVPPKGEHVRSLAWNPVTQRWLGLSHRYATGPAAFQLLEIDESGNPTTVGSVEAGSDAKFLASGQYVVTATGSVISTASGTVMWRFG